MPPQRSNPQRLLLVVVLIILIILIVLIVVVVPGTIVLVGIADRRLRIPVPGVDSRIGLAIRGAW